MGYDEITNKNDMALCTVGGPTFQKKKSKVQKSVENVTICIKTKKKGYMCKYLYVD